MVAILSVVIGIMGVIIIPLVAIAFRAAIRWKGIEDKMEGIASDLKDIVDDKNRVHTEIVAQMREDRRATDRRLRWLEENLWSHGNSPQRLPAVRK